MRTMQKVVVVIFLCSAASVGQTNKGGIRGTVADPTGANVPGAKVTVTNVGTSQSVTVVTSAEGTYSAASLDPVTYNVVVEANGFKKAIIEKVKVDTATIATVNVTLELGTVAETVSVAADAQLLNTESGTTGNTITQRQLTDLPLSNRSVLDLASTLPNVSGDVGFDQSIVASNTTAPGFNLSVNGGRPGCGRPTTLDLVSSIILEEAAALSPRGTFSSESSCSSR